MDEFSPFLAHFMANSLHTYKDMDTNLLNMETQSNCGRGAIKYS